MSFIMAATAVVSAGIGVYQAVQGKNAADDAAEEAKAAQVELDKQKKAFEALDTSNPYKNVMEDLTVDQRAAEFTRQQQMQSQANIMDQMRGAAGGSGIAALAQTLANQGSMDARAASANIAQQERQNQQMQANEEIRIQGGEVMSRNMKSQKIQGLMGLAGGDLAAARQMQMAGQDQMQAGLSQAASGVMQAGTAIGNREIKTTEVTPTPTTQPTQVASNQVPTTQTTTVPVVGGFAQTGGISTPANLGGNQILGGTGSNTSWSPGLTFNPITGQYE